MKVATNPNTMYTRVQLSQLSKGDIFKSICTKEFYMVISTVVEDFEKRYLVVSLDTGLMTTRNINEKVFTPKSKKLDTTNSDIETIEHLLHGCVFITARNYRIRGHDIDPDRDDNYYMKCTDLGNYYKLDHTPVLCLTDYKIYQCPNDVEVSEVHNVSIQLE